MADVGCKPSLQQRPAETNPGRSCQHGYGYSGLRPFSKLDPCTFESSARPTPGYPANRDNLLPPRSAATTQTTTVAMSAPSPAKPRATSLMHTPGIQTPAEVSITPR